MERKTIEKIEETKEHTLVIEGRNAVLEAFRSGRTIDKLFVLDGCQDGPVRTIVREAKKHGTILNFVGKERLSQLTQTGRHQGVIAYAAAYDYAEIDDMLKLAEKRGEDPFLIVLDGIEDPHNLGAIIRTANIAGAHGVIIPKRRAVGLTARKCLSNARCGENFGRGVELYSGCKSDKSCKDNGRIERKRNLVCLRRYGRREHVPFKSHRTDRSCDRK